MKMRRCEDEKVRYRPPLLEEPCAQTLSGTSKSIKGQRRALELQEGGGCSAASAQHVHAARRAVLALETRLLLAECFQILTSSEAASALAVAVSAKPLQHQASCFRLSKLLWLVLTLFRLLTLKLRYILSQFLYIAGRDGLFAKIGIGWGGLKRQGKDFGFLVESTNGLNLRDDYPQILGDSRKALIWRQSWLLNMCFFVLSLGASKKFNGPRINGWECPLLRSFRVVLEPPKGRTTRGRNWNTLKYEFFKGLCPIVVLSLGASGTSLNLLRTGRIVLSLGACLRSASLQEPRLMHFTEACG